MRAHDTRSLIRFILVLTAVLAIGGYGLWRSYAYLMGPRLRIESPASGSLVDGPLVTIEGSAQRVSTLTLNGRTIYTDEAGRIRESLLLVPGYNILVLQAVDRFARTKEVRLELVRSETHYAKTN